jgi:hypothetical protein
MENKKGVYLTPFQRYGAVTLALFSICYTIVAAKVIQGNAPGAVVVPGGTTVVVALAKPISSATANVNDEVGVVVKKDVDVNGWVVIPAGATGLATVTAVQHAGGGGNGGKLTMSVDWVSRADGGTIAVSPTSHLFDDVNRSRDVTIGTDENFTVFVDHSVHLRATQKVT